MARQDTKSDGVQDQPWWTSGSKYALAFLVVSNLAVLLTIFVPEFSHWKDRHLQKSISQSQQHQEGEIAKANQTLTSLNRQVEITRLLFDHFFGRPTQEQTAVVQYLRWQFPNDLRKKSLQAILFEPKKPSLRRQIDQSVAAVQVRRAGRVLVAAPVGQSKINVAASKERRGSSRSSTATPPQPARRSRRRTRRIRRFTTSTNSVIAPSPRTRSRSSEMPRRRNETRF